mmetsp:Transcript_52796/g.125685  ORF Transcript_52796/g.125685 Transcript_52796/m.125685 type:complete len:518 (+) Transcript_52796:27-1580(+)
MRAAALHRTLLASASRSPPAGLASPAAHAGAAFGVVAGKPARRDRSVGAVWRASSVLVLRVPERLAARGVPGGSRALSAQAEAPAEDAEAVAGPGGFTMADADPSTHHRPDAGKVYPLHKEALKEIMPEGLGGLMHRIMFGSRNEHKKIYDDKWCDMILKNKPGMLIRKQSVELITALLAMSHEGVKSGKPAIWSSGFLLDGPPGSGKSMILNHVVHWARARGDWIVVFIPEASHLCIGYGFYQRGETAEGLPTILQPAYAQKILEQILHANEEKLKEIEVVAPQPEESEGGEPEKRPVAEVIAALLKMPMIGREELSVNTLVAVMDALRTQTKFPVLIAVDEINALCGTTKYPTYDSTGLIPASQVVVAEVFSRFVNADLKRGVVVGAATRTGLFQNHRLPAFKKHPMQVRGFTRLELAAYLSYVRHVGEFFTEVSNELLDYLLFTTAGRPALVERAMGSELFNLGQVNAPKKKKIGRFYRDTGGTHGMLQDHPVENMMQETPAQIRRAAAAAGGR